MDEHKKYRPLDEVYLKESFAKSVPLPPYRIVIREDADVVIQKDPPHGEVKEYRVSDEVAKEIRNTIKKQEVSKTEEGDLTASAIIDKVLEIDGWKSGTRDYPALLERVIGIFSRGEIIPQNFNSLITIQKDPNNKFRKDLLSNPQQVYAYQDLIPESFLKLFEANGGLKVADELWGVTFKAKVNVGAGELAFTLLSDAVKGKTGDLLFKDIGEVEVKGLGARMGGDGFCHNHTPNELNKILSKDSGNLTEQTLQRVKAEIFKKIETFIKSREALKGRVTVPKEQQIQYLSQVRDSLDNSENLNQLLTNIANFGLPATVQAQLKQAVKDYTEHKTGQVKGLFSPAIKTFFSLSKNMSDEQLAAGIAATRNYSATTEVPELIQYLTNMLSQKRNDFFPQQGSNAYNYNLYRLIASIHTALYRAVQKFNYILFINDNTKKMVVYKFEEGNLGQTIESIYNFYSKYDAAFNMSIDDKFKSAGVTLKI